MNIFTFSGNLGRDSNVNQAGGSTVCNFAVAVKSGYGDKEQTHWVDCALWGKQAESRLPEFLKKGKKVMVSGELGTREHEGKTYLTCRVQSIDLAGEAGSQQQQPGGFQQPQNQPQNQPQQGTSGYGTGGPQAPQQQQSQNMGIDSDIPF